MRRIKRIHRRLRDASFAVVLVTASLLVAGEASAVSPVSVEERYEAAFNQAATAARDWAAQNGVGNVYVELCKSENWQYLREQFQAVNSFSKEDPGAEATLLNRKVAAYEAWMRNGLEQCASDLQDRAEVRARVQRLDSARRMSEAGVRLRSQTV